MKIELIRVHTSLLRVMYPHIVLTTSEGCKTQANAVLPFS